MEILESIISNPQFFILFGVLVIGVFVLNFLKQLIKLVIGVCILIFGVSLFLHSSPEDIFQLGIESTKIDYSFLENKVKPMFDDISIDSLWESGEKAREWVNLNLNKSE
ncbi:hypothetical protein [Bacillus solitudinis]|uniref:hypothetical protein n=1 Tax=Bacillus solitudinis TaxID=2014074 RepID=UPI000C241453|nr:hypothetical protein [Bacillus solitudinis]